VPTIILTTSDAPADRVDAARATGTDVVAAEPAPSTSPSRSTAWRNQGLGRILCEGGPHLLANSPKPPPRRTVTCRSPATASATRTASSTARTSEGLPLILHTLLTEDGFLFARYISEPL